MLIKQLVIQADNKVGELYNIVNILAKANIDIKALLSTGEIKNGILQTTIRLIVMNNELSMSILEKNGYECRYEDVVIVDLSDTTGSFVPILECIKKNELNIEYVYTFLTHVENKALAVFSFDNNERALDVLKNNHFTIVTDHTIKNRYGSQEYYEERELREYLSTIITP